MSIAPAPSASRGELILQPNYFTSSVYVKALRHDISILILRYHEIYSQSASSNPFDLFKILWLSQGWNWLHFKVFDDRSRQTFLDITFRLFLERTVKTEAPFIRVAALFGLYIFFYTQIKDTTPRIYSTRHIPIPADHYISLKNLPEVVATTHIRNLQSYTTFILSCLWKDQVFFILPKNELGPLNPRDLPRELFAHEGPLANSESGPQKRKGRPAGREKSKKARAALKGLDEWIAKPSTNQQDEIDPLSEYQAAKTSMMNVLAPEVVMDGVNASVLERLQMARESVPINEKEIDLNVGIPRIERAIECGGWGILSLLEGAGTGPGRRVDSLGKDLTDINVVDS
ncbi:hypothetical protein BYT27DRAFT_7189838 [Phlegmacium glaucopus]|nr:hypothetical protein BYT27DRAFT_7189838 [Phlegmacium glaucopus]